MGGNLGYDVTVVLDATRTFDLTADVAGLGIVTHTACGAHGDDRAGAAGRRIREDRLDRRCSRGLADRAFPTFNPTSEVGYKFESRCRTCRTSVLFCRDEGDRAGEGAGEGCDRRGHTPPCPARAGAGSFAGRAGPADASGLLVPAARGRAPPGRGVLDRLVLVAPAGAAGAALAVGHLVRCDRHARARRRGGRACGHRPREAGADPRARAALARRGLDRRRGAHGGGGATFLAQPPTATSRVWPLGCATAGPCCSCKGPGRRSRRRSS